MTLQKSVLLAAAVLLVACPQSAVRIRAVDAKGNEIPAAALRIDGRERGETPFAGNLSYGHHELELSASGYEPKKRSQKIRSTRLALRISLDRSVHKEEAELPAGTRFGSLDPAVIDKTIKLHLDAIQKCVETWSSRGELRLGKIVEHFVIESDGRVDVAYPGSSEVAAPDIEACIDQTFRRIKFDQPENGGIVSVNYPLLFRGERRRPRAATSVDRRAPSSRPAVRRRLRAPDSRAPCCEARAPYR